MASFKKSLRLFLSLLFALPCYCHAYTFNVGGRDGWTLHPSENYNQWSGRLRFLVNDTLHFKYNGGSDSVMEVSKGDYDNCNTNSPITTLNGGDSLFKLNRSGPFYFISGNKSNCDQGQKLTVVVLSPKKKPPPPTAAPSASSSLAPAVSPVSSTSSSPTPAVSPVSSSSSSPAPAVSPVSSSPESGTSISTPPASSPGGGPSSSPTGNSADVNAPPPRGSSATRPAFSATSTASLVTLIFGLVWLY